jgi:hypothetical protein
MRTHCVDVIPCFFDTQQLDTREAKPGTGHGARNGRIGQYPEAAKAYTAARRLVPDDAVAQGRLCMKHSALADRSGNYPQALRWIQRGMQGLESHDDPAAVQQLARLVGRSGSIVRR